MTDRKQVTRPLLEVVEECLEGGLRAVQLREKDLPVRELLGMAAPLREATRRRGARFLVNDRVDVALAVGADGAQRTHESLPVSVMREVGGPGFMVGASVHSVAEARTVAAEGADFIVFGPVFDTPSKHPYGPPQGLAALGQVTAAVATPVLAIGGITADRVRDILAVGAVGVGVISAILAAARPRDATRAFLDALGSA